ncbi:hypothetical protein EV175_005139 [Coemansia sp. RSA 1933]|nr:hypothetical protein EV175_005139 [Coemansia sp. RSA 1933]
MHMAMALLGICRAWTHVARTLLAKHIYADLSPSSCIPISCMAQRYSSASSVVRACLQRSARTAVVRIPVNVLRDGAFGDIWDVTMGSELEQTFPAVRSLSLCIYWPPDLDDSDPEHPEMHTGYQMDRQNRKLVRRAASRLANAFPALRHIELQCGKVQTHVASAMTGALFRNFVAQTRSHVRTIGYCAWDHLVKTDYLPMATGLTRLCINQVVYNTSTSLQLAVGNAATLQTMDLSLGASFLCASLLLDESGGLVQYKRMQWLRLAVYGGVPFVHRNICNGAFPGLKHLLLPGVFPFSDSAILDSNAMTLESLCLGVSSYMLHPYTERFQLLSSGRFPRLRSVELRALPAADPFLLPGLNDQTVEHVPLAYYHMACALATNATQLVLDFGSTHRHCDLSNKEALFDAMDRFAMQGLELLDLRSGCSVLGVEDIAALSKRLPTLVHLLCRARTVDGLEGDPVGGSKLRELSLMIQDDSVTPFVSRLELVLPVLERINVYPAESSGQPWLLQSCSMQSRVTLRRYSTASTTNCAPVAYDEWWHE